MSIRTRCRVAALTAAFACTPLAAFADNGDVITVEGLLKGGWEIAGYAGNFDGRSFILFKHKDKPFLTQCSVLYDVTRSPRVVTNCYEVH